MPSINRKIRQYLSSVFVHCISPKALDNVINHIYGIIITDKFVMPPKGLKGLCSFCLLSKPVDKVFEIDEVPRILFLVTYLLAKFSLFITFLLTLLMVCGRLKAHCSDCCCLEIACITPMQCGGNASYWCYLTRYYFI